VYADEASVHSYWRVGRQSLFLWWDAQHRTARKTSSKACNHTLRACLTSPPNRPIANYRVRFAVSPCPGGQPSILEGGTCPFQTCETGAPSRIITAIAASGSQPLRQLLECLFYQARLDLPRQTQGPRNHLHLFDTTAASPRRGMR
jgi:hypothetical protein